MNTRIRVYALSILRLWYGVRDPRNHWHNQQACQAYQDSMQALRYTRLIEDYSIEPVKVKIKGVWYE